MKSTSLGFPEWGVCTAQKTTCPPLCREPHLCFLALWVQTAHQVTCPHNPVTATVCIFQSNVFLPHIKHIVPGFSATEEFCVFLKRLVPATRKDREFSHIVRTVLGGFLGHGLLPHKNHPPPSLVLNWRVCIAQKTEYLFYPRNSTCRFPLSRCSCWVSFFGYPSA